MLWLSVLVILVFGGPPSGCMTRPSIKWKPTILYWLFGLILLGGRLFLQRNLLQAARSRRSWSAPAHLGATAVALDRFSFRDRYREPVVAFNLPTDLWVNFKLFGLFGLTLVFTLGIGIWLARHMKEVPDA